MFEFPSETLARAKMRLAYEKAITYEQYEKAQKLHHQLQEKTEI
ncbi:MAG: hypothetical protein ACMXYA_01710 [Candidatus Woesearchaeota archaeon]